MLFIKFNKQPLRRKLLIIYTVGFLIPIISINLLFSYNIYQEQMEFSRKNFISSMEKVKLIVETEMQRSINDIYNIFINNELYTFLQRDYQSIREYLNEKRKVTDIERALNNIRLKSKNLEIYTSNETIPQDSNFKYLDDTVKTTQWYKDFSKSGATILIHHSTATPQIISIIRKLNLGSSSRWDHIIKTDIPIYKLEEEFNRLLINDNFRIVSYKGNTVFSTNELKNNYIEIKTEFDLKPLSNWYIEGRIENYPFLNSAFYTGKRVIIVSILLIVIIGSLVIYILSKSFYNRIYNLSQKIRNIKNGKFEEVYVNQETRDEITELALSYNVMTQKIHELINEVSEAKLREKNIEIVKRKAQINALRSQINPHYLFNVLESIRMKSLIKGEKETGEIIKHLSKSFRHIISWDSNIINIKQELEIAKDFLVVQKYRFGDKLDYEILVDKECEDIEIPKLTLQPFIENSCIHGIEKSSKNGKITISIQQSHGKIICKIIDNGVGIKDEDVIELKESIEYFELDHKHIGFSNAYWRLKNHYHDLLFDIDTKEGVGTKITITIPNRNKGQ